VQFRQQALAKLQSPEELDLPVRFARPQGWLVLSVTVVVMAAASVWAVTGSVASTVNAAAVLTHGEGSYILQSPAAGQITAVALRNPWGVDGIDADSNPDDGLMTISINTLYACIGRVNWGRV